MKYLLLSSSRSGSALLKHSLITLFNENVDGPDEWIVHPKTRLNLRLPENYEEANNMVIKTPRLLFQKMSPNSHRKVMYSHLKTPRNLPKHIPVIHLIRKDSWAQAKSYWIMKQRFIPSHVKEKVHEEVKEKAIHFDIDYGEIEKFARKFYKQKQTWYYALKNRKNTLLFYYEEDLANSEVFKNTTLPKIEAFLNKKRQIEDYDFPLKKTRSLYSIENINRIKEKKLSKKYYFKPAFKYWLKHQLKHILGI